MNLDSLSRKQGNVAEAQIAEETVGERWELGDAQRAKSQVSIIFLSQYKPQLNKRTDCITNIAYSLEPPFHAQTMNRIIFGLSTF